MSIRPNPKDEVPKFRLGRIVATANALLRLTPAEIDIALSRHAVGDWGELCSQDEESNDKSLINGGALYSVYTSDTGVRFYVITEWDRSVTTVLCPEDY